ncbi:hypothetical protein [Alteromonas sp. ASW11-130]|uniref:hypothetical protein n=1 Tax=Alteromonas sp. ASW11-130 TaxID=3015775 RepID=UPI0022423A50|nr:hypothetical protein [Alteromonas sp. ASW11-130]MCW8091825.1 hypothetical protein [Alteromonas sp. ASW11-130]
MIKSIQLLVLASLFLLGCGGESREESIQENDEFEVVDDIQNDKQDYGADDGIADIYIEIEAIDSLWASGTQNVISSWNEQILIPTLTGLLRFTLDKNGYIDQHELLPEFLFNIIQVQDNVIAAHNFNHIEFYAYDGDNLSLIEKTPDEALKQTALAHNKNCFYWLVTAEQQTSLSSVKQACIEDDGIIINTIIMREDYIDNVYAFSDDHLAIFSTPIDDASKNSKLTIYKKHGSHYETVSDVETGESWWPLDIDSFEGNIYAPVKPTDQPDSDGSGGLVKFEISDSSIEKIVKISDLVTDNTGYDIIAQTPAGLMLGNDKKLIHFIIEEGKVVRRVTAEIENSISSIYIHGDYVVVVLRNPPSSYSTGEDGPQGVHIYPYQNFIQQE